MTSSDEATTPILVVGATGATGKHVVRQLLQQGKQVRVIVRSKERMMDALKNADGKQELLSNDIVEKNLIVKEASLLDLSDEELQEQVQGVQAVVSCLGHNMDMKGIFDKPRRLVTDAVRKLTTAMEKTTTNITPQKPKFILMGSDGVANPAGTDDKRSFVERALLCILRQLIPPHADNEDAAAYLYNYNRDSSGKKVEWCVVRPTDLIDSDVVGKYVLYDKPKGSLFGSGSASRINVAKTMVDLIIGPKMWEQYKFTLPVMYDDDEEGETSGKKSSSEL